MDRSFPRLLHGTALERTVAFGENVRPFGTLDSIKENWELILFPLGGEVFHEFVSNRFESQQSSVSDCITAALGLCVEDGQLQPRQQLRQFGVLLGESESPIPNDFILIENPDEVICAVAAAVVSSMARLKNVSRIAGAMFRAADFTLLTP